MKLIWLLCSFCLCSGCVAPSMTIYGTGVTYDRNGNPKAVAMKEAQIYGDLAGNTTIQGSIVRISAEHGYYNSTVARENYKGIGLIGRTWLQPIVWGAISGGVTADAISNAARSSTRVFNP